MVLESNRYLMVLIINKLDKRRGGSVKGKTLTQATGAGHCSIDK